MYLEFLENAKNKQVSEHFTEYDICHSDTAIRLNINNIPNATVDNNAKLLINKVLEPLCIALGKITINCMYRCFELNRKVGSTPTSQHILGMAVDFTIPGYSLMEIVDYIRKHLDFDQLILENGWIHVSYSLGHNRKQVLKYVNGKYIMI